MKFTAILTLVLGLAIAGCSGGTPSDPESFSDELHEAVEEGNMPEIHDLLNRGANINARHPDNGETPLIIAVRMGSVDIVQELLVKGADANKTHRGDTPLHLAASVAAFKITTLLLDHGANPQLRNGKNKIPLEIAADKKFNKYFFFLQDESNKRRRYQ